MKISDFLTGIMAMGLLVLLYMHINLTKEVREGSRRSYSSSGQDSIFRVNTMARFKSLEQKDSVLAETIVYLDSCNQVKATKVERAEKRGRFIGGLLRGLFPGI